MTTELILLRHAKSDWDAHGDDFNRPLNTRGHHDAPRIGQWLQQQAIKPNCILSSPARRAAQTAEAICAALDDPSISITWEPRLYLASRETLLDVISEHLTHSCLMVIGHNPGLEQLLDCLAQEPPQRQTNGNLLTTATLAHLQWTSAAHGLDRASARLLHLIRPRELAN